MSDVMQGYDMEAAVSQIGKAICKAAKAAPDTAAAFARRAIEADMRYMHETGVLDDEGLMGDGEYDEDDAFEALFAALTDGVEDDGEIGKIAQMLDAYMDAQQHRRHEVRPGLTGLAQVTGRNALDWDTKLALDVKYVDTCSFIGDVKIFLRTIVKVFRREDIAFETEGYDMDLKDWNERKSQQKQKAM